LRGPGADEHYWNALSAGRVEMQQCAQCARWHWPAVWRCGECGSWQHTWHEVEPRGTVFTWTRTWHDFGTPRQLGLPFVTVVVSLDGAGHRRLMGTLVGDDSHLRIGAPVSGEIGSLQVDGQDLPVLRWRLLGESGAGGARP